MTGIIAILTLFAVTVVNSTPKRREKGFVPLFNGKDLRGWRVIGTPAWKVENGILVCTGKGAGWIRTEKQYENFVLRLAFRISKRGNSGIFLRAAPIGNPAFTGMEVQILDDYNRPPADYTTGAIYAAVAPKKNMSKPPGEWNHVEIICWGPWVVIWINGEEVVRVNMDEHPKLRHRRRKGFIGLQNHGSRVEFRDIRIKVLPSTGGK